MDRSPVSFGAMFDGEDLNRPRADAGEQDPIVRDPEPKLFTWRTEFLHVAGTVCQVIVNGVQDRQGRLAVNREKLRPGAASPDDDLFPLHRRRRSAWLQPEVAKHFVVRDTFAMIE